MALHITAPPGLPAIPVVAAAQEYLKTVPPREYASTLRAKMLYYETAGTEHATFIAEEMQAYLTLIAMECAEHCCVPHENKFVVQLMGTILHDLVGISEQTPSDQRIDWALRFLQIVQMSADHTSNGQFLMAQLKGRLIHLAQDKKVTELMQVQINDFLRRW